MKRILATASLMILLNGCFGPYRNPLILEDANGQTILELKSPYFKSSTKDAGYWVVCSNKANNFEYGFDYTGTLSAQSASLVGYKSGTEKPIKDFAPIITQTNTSTKVTFTVPTEMTPQNVAPQSITTKPPNPPSTYLKLFIQSGNVNKYLYIQELEVIVCP